MRRAKRHIFNAVSPAKGKKLVEVNGKKSFAEISEAMHRDLD
jgi:hypothetical protein